VPQVAALATGVIVARLKAANAARMSMFIGFLHLSSGEMSGFIEPEMDPLVGLNNSDPTHWIYA